MRCESMWRDRKVSAFPHEPTEGFESEPINRSAATGDVYWNHVRARDRAMVGPPTYLHWQHPRCFKARTRHLRLRRALDDVVAESRLEAYKRWPEEPEAWLEKREGGAPRSRHAPANLDCGVASSGRNRCRMSVLRFRTESLCGPCYDRSHVCASAVAARPTVAARQERTGHEVSDIGQTFADMFLCRTRV